MYTYFGYTTIYKLFIMNKVKIGKTLYSTEPKPDNRCRGCYFEDRLCRPQAFNICSEQKVLFKRIPKK